MAVAFSRWQLNGMAATLQGSFHQRWLPRYRWKWHHSAVCQATSSGEPMLHTLFSPTEINDGIIFFHQNTSVQDISVKGQLIRTVESNLHCHWSLPTQNSETVHCRVTWLTFSWTPMATASSHRSRNLNITSGSMALPLLSVWHAPSPAS